MILEGPMVVFLWENCPGWKGLPGVVFPAGVSSALGV